jgi:hypothetical protein
MRIWSWVHSESAQDSFEWLVAIALVALPLALAMVLFTGVVPAVVGHSCPSIDTAVDPTATPNGSCVTQGP